MKIKALYVYPIKALRGIPMSSSHALKYGFQHDRVFMLIRTSDDRQINTSKFQMAALFGTRFGFDSGNVPLDEAAGHGVQETTSVVVHYTLSHVFDRPQSPVDPGDLEISLRPDTKGLEEVEVDMYSSCCIAWDLGEKYNSWFSERFGFGVRLVHIGMNRRPVLGNLLPGSPQNGVSSNGTTSNARVNGAEHTGQNGSSWFGSGFSFARSIFGSVLNWGPTATNSSESGAGLTFSPVAPYLVVSQTSFDDVQSRFEGLEVDMEKFRPNIVLSGAEAAYDEDYWAEIVVRRKEKVVQEEVKFVLTQNCPRCEAINTSFETGRHALGQEGELLKRMQKDRRVDLGMKYSPVFGRYGFIAMKGGNDSRGRDRSMVEGVRLSVGDEVQVVKRNPERTRFQWPGLSTDT